MILMLFIKRIKNVYLFIYHLKRVCMCCECKYIRRTFPRLLLCGSGSGCTSTDEESVAKGPCSVFLEPPELILIIYRVFPPSIQQTNLRCSLELNIIASPTSVNSPLYTLYYSNNKKGASDLLEPARLHLQAQTCSRHIVSFFYIYFFCSRKYIFVYLSKIKSMLEYLGIKSDPNPCRPSLLHCLNIHTHNLGLSPAPLPCYLS